MLSHKANYKFYPTPYEARLLNKWDSIKADPLRDGADVLRELLAKGLDEINCVVAEAIRFEKDNSDEFRRQFAFLQLYFKEKLWQVLNNLNHSNVDYLYILEIANQYRKAFKKILTNVSNSAISDSNKNWARYILNSMLYNCHVIIIKASFNNNDFNINDFNTILKSVCDCYELTTDIQFLAPEQMNVNRVELFLTLTKLFTRQNNLKEAYKNLNQALSYIGKLAQTDKLLMSIAIKVHATDLGQAFLDNDQPFNAIECFDIALKHSPLNNNSEVADKLTLAKSKHLEHVVNTLNSSVTTSHPKILKGKTTAILRIKFDDANYKPDSHTSFKLSKSGDIEFISDLYTHSAQNIKNAVKELEEDYSRYQNEKIALSNRSPATQDDAIKNATSLQNPEKQQEIVKQEHPIKKEKKKKQKHKQKKIVKPVSAQSATSNHHDFANNVNNNNANVASANNPPATTQNRDYFTAEELGFSEEFKDKKIYEIKSCYLSGIYYGFFEREAAEKENIDATVLDQHEDKLKQGELGKGIKVVRGTDAFKTWISSTAPAGNFRMFGRPVNKVGGKILLAFKEPHDHQSQKKAHKKG